MRFKGVASFDVRGKKKELSYNITADNKTSAWLAFMACIDAQEQVWGYRFDGNCILMEVIENEGPD